MENEKLSKWADLLLDTGKSNNAINFKDFKKSTVEVIYPDLNTIFKKAEHGITFEVYDSKLDDVDNFENKVVSKEEYLKRYLRYLKKNKQILIYNPLINPILSIKEIGKKAKTAIEEQGINIAYIVFGFLNWAEKDDQTNIMQAPLLLVPISIVNDSETSGYSIKITDNDIILNPTLAYKMKSDYGLELPNYEEGDLETYFVKVEMLTTRLNWTISRVCKIGIFSFNKINMYKDLQDNEKVIVKNPNIAKLLGEKIVDELNNCQSDNYQLANVIDADASQIEAIEMVKKGQSFVLQGPPGTGKSQTITNIIAECLSDGKKVLFVSEKLAALNVVYDKLKKVGLEEFCLELHSHKANKKEVIDELCRTLNAPVSVVSSKAEQELDDKHQFEVTLDEYVTKLHTVNPVINKSLYQIYGEVVECKDVCDIDFIINNIENHDEKYLKEVEKNLSHYVGYTKIVGTDYRQNIWYGYINVDNTYQNLIKLKIALQNNIKQCTELLKIEEELENLYDINLNNMDYLKMTMEFLNLMSNTKFITPKLLQNVELDKILQRVKAMQCLAQEIFDIENCLDNSFNKEIYNYSGFDLEDDLVHKYHHFLKRIFSKKYKILIKELKSIKKGKKKIKYQELVSTLNLLKTYQLKMLIFNEEDNIKDYFNSGYQGIKTDFKFLYTELEKLQEIKKQNFDFGIFQKMSLEEFLKEQSEISKYCHQIQLVLEKYQDSFQEIECCFEKNIYNVNTISLKDAKNKYCNLLDAIDQLNTWCEFLKLLKNLESLEIKEFIDLAINKHLKTDDLIKIYKKTFYTQWIDVILHSTPFLMQMSRVQHDEIVKSFKIKDELSFEINKAKIKAKLSQERPSLDIIAPGSAVSILLREGEKRRKQKPIRLLFETLGELVQTLKPCFLMSPLSVSTFLSKDFAFDVVIFDEASQIFPQDAIGAIYRGKQLIVVGDSKQMPPTNFFNASSFQDDDEINEDITDFESILDLCSTIFPQKSLKWHYRSRSEELIAFSNKNFYNDELKTFPQTENKKGLGVDFLYVEGTFDRKTKQNVIEAEKIVDLIYENIEKYPSRSLGVVAFSIAQQNLIEKLLAKKRKENPIYESFLRDKVNEPFFIKNLETVQGDERDTIIFSIAYGKDVNGKLLLNFGPLNKEGGERRLNVAITRAKENLIIVSSMHYLDIDLTRTKSLGSKLLRDYLDYAENGWVVFKESNINKNVENESGFETEVGEFLRNNGFDVDFKIGSSAYQIDIGVKKPHSNRYILAIECDGKTYRNIKNVRDRDRLRQSILEKIGWHYYRLWSTDWFLNKEIEKIKLLNEVNYALENLPIESENEVNDEQPLFLEEGNLKHYEFPKYEKVDEELIASIHNYQKNKVIKEIILKEAPISEEWLLKRIAFLFGRKKVTSVVKEEFYKIIKSFPDIRKENGFYYVKGKQISELRIPLDDIREVKYICLEELSCGIHEIVRQSIMISKNGLYKCLMQLLGYNRLSDEMINRFNDALILISDEIIKNGQNLSLK